CGTAGTRPHAGEWHPVASRAQEVWRDLLGDPGFALATLITRDARPASPIAASLDVACTLVWSALECLKKSGVPADAPLVLDTSGADDAVRLRSGLLVIAGLLARTATSPSGIVFAVLVLDTHDASGSEPVVTPATAGLTSV